MKKLKKPLIYLFIIIVVLVLNRQLNLTVYFSDFHKIEAIINDNFLLAILTYIGLTVFACVVLALPGVTFAIIAGLMFGQFWGTIACLIATTLGASIAFLVGRYFLKDSVKPMLEKNKLLKNLLFSKNNSNDVLLLMITRLVPIFPYNIQNFAYGVTDIGFWKYTGLTFLFMIPGVSIYTIGSAGLASKENRLTYFLTATIVLIIVSVIGLILKRKYLSKKRGIILFTRIPSSGNGKTRLRTHLSSCECETLQEKFIMDICNSCNQVLADLLVAFDVEGNLESLKAMVGKDAQFFPQKGEGMGEKMSEAFKKAFELGYDQVILIGSDIPHISQEILQDAFDSLEDKDAILSPTEDGGYYLIGLNKGKEQGIFDIEGYGSSAAFQATKEEMEKLNISYCLGEKNFDIDLWEDVEKLRELVDKEESICPKSREYIKFLHDKVKNENISHSTSI